MIVKNGGLLGRSRFPVLGKSGGIWRQGYTIPENNLLNIYSRFHPYIPQKNFVTSNLILYIDPKYSNSYLRSGNTISDIGGGSYDGTFYTVGTGSVNYLDQNSGAIDILCSSNGNGGALGVTYSLPVGAWTVEMVCKFTLQSFWASVWGSDVYSSSRGYWCLFQNSTTMTLGSAAGTSYATGQFFTPASSVGNVSHWVWVNTGSAYTVYQNNVSCSKSGSYTAPSSASTVGTVFGSRHGNSATDNSSIGDNMPITIYLIRIYNKALSADEVKFNFQGCRQRFNL